MGVDLVLADSTLTGSTLDAIRRAQTRGKNLLSLAGVLEDVGAVIHVMFIHIVIIAVMVLVAGDDGAGEGGGSEKGRRKERSCETHIEDCCGAEGREWLKSVPKEIRK